MCVFIWMYVYIYVYIYVYTYVFMYIYLCQYILDVYTDLHAAVVVFFKYESYTSIEKKACKQTFVYIHTHVPAHTRIDMYMDAYT